MPDAARDAGEDRCVAQSVGARLARPQLMDQIEEVARLVALERDHELLVVEPERVRRVDADLRVAAADRDVLAHDAHALLGRKAVPLALLLERIHEQVLVLAGVDLEPVLLGVLGLLGHREVGVGRVGPSHQAALAQHDVELVDVGEARGGGPQHQVGVAARADQRVCAQEAVRGEVVAGRLELALVRLPLGERQAPPGRVHLQKRELDDIAVHGSHINIRGAARRFWRWRCSQPPGPRPRSARGPRSSSGPARSRSLSLPRSSGWRRRPGSTPSASCRRSRARTRPSRPSST